MKLHEFIDTFREEIIRKTAQGSEPLYHPAKDRELTYGLINGLARKTIACQIDAIGATVKALNEGDAAILVGEMGLGKTYCSTATSYALKYKRTLIVCPPHLTKKWRREILITLPEARVEIPQSITELECALREKEKPLYIILSREKAKLSYYWKPVFKTNRDGQALCHNCKSPLLDRDEVPLSLKAMEARKRRCENCKEPLWQADPSGPRRFPLATYLKRKHPRAFDLLITDECHEYKGPATAQGIALDHLTRTARKCIALTGTLLGGYSSNLFYLLYRVSRDIRKDFTFKDVKKWMELYGVLEKITYLEKDDDGKASLKKNANVQWHEKPGISPALIPELLPRAIFLKLQDLGIALPPYQEIPHAITMDEGHQKAYTDFQEQMLSELRAALQRGSKRLLGKYLQCLLAYSDAPWLDEVVKDGDRDIAETTPLPKDRLYPKEKKLIEICKEAKAAGRKICVYAVHTDKRDLTPRLKEILERNGLTASVLRASEVPPTKREEWINRNPTDVLITHPKNVALGLDLIKYPTIVWYQQDYSIYTHRQGSRRSWRIGQTKRVQVHHLYYTNSIQSKALTLNIQKLRAALLTEGDLIEEGIATQGDTDALISLAKAIISKSKEKVSLESELERLRALEEIPTHTTWEETADPQAEEPPQPALPGPDLHRQAELLRNLRQQRQARRKPAPANQLALFALAT